MSTKATLDDRNLLFRLTPEHATRLEHAPIYDDLFLESHSAIFRTPAPRELSHRVIKDHNKEKGDALSSVLAHPAVYSEAATMLCAYTHIALGAKSPFKGPLDPDMSSAVAALNDVRAAAGMTLPQMASQATHLHGLLADARKIGAQHDKAHGTEFFTNAKGGYHHPETELPEALIALARENAPAADSAYVAENVEGKIRLTLAMKPKKMDLLAGALDMTSECRSPEEKMGAALGYLIGNFARRAIGRPYKESVSAGEAERFQLHETIATGLMKQASVGNTKESKIPTPTADPGLVETGVAHGEGEDVHAAEPSAPAREDAARSTADVAPEAAKTKSAGVDVTPPEGTSGERSPVEMLAEMESASGSSSESAVVEPENPERRGVDLAASVPGEGDAIPRAMKPREGRDHP